MRDYANSFEGIGYARGCMIHLVLLGLLCIAALVWAIRNRAWELEVTVEMPAAQKEPEAPAEPPQ